VNKVSCSEIPRDTISGNAVGMGFR